MFPAVSAGHPLDLNHLWQQVQELSAVLAANRENTVGLVRKANELRNYTAGAVPGAEATDNVVNGNVAIPSQRELELAEENRQLRQEVAGLRTENEDLGLLVQDYETVLEKVLEGLRVYAHEHSLATINIHSSYTNQLANERAANAALRQREIDTQARLTNLSTWIREAYAHATELEPDIIIEQYKAENAALREALGINDEPDSSEEGE
ncbi:hypothetical protein FN846DRAFT_780525 [Sphaerosporella brunnea]|uniref:Uncharacterized protein n=1 Tax=Sphaerosporella brunnea TaxID=1250544 RepID=A0A5J5ETN8_9PEZI|nr:hypothetical protein FN846DRAFT_780525 [Sphaerosporella brunnea]